MPRTPHKHKKAAPLSQLRIIGGQLRGRKLAIANVSGLRPTTDRLRETLFNWIQFELSGARVLDVFAGTGALGIEALSRGAEQVDLWERDAQAATLLRQHLEQLQTECSGQAAVSQGDALQKLQQTPAHPYDVVFLDPPFRQQLLQPSIDALQANDWLTEDTWVYVETERRHHDTIPSNWRLHRELVAGSVWIRLFQVTAVTA